MSLISRLVSRSMSSMKTTSGLSSFLSSRSISDRNSSRDFSRNAAQSPSARDNVSARRDITDKNRKNKEPPNAIHINHGATLLSATAKEVNVVIERSATAQFRV